MGETVAYVGVDYHSGVIQVCAVSADGQELLNRRCANHWRAVAGCLGPGCRVQACIEATSGAADLAEELIAGGGWSVVLAHPGYVARMRGNPDKSDVADARLLADLRRVGYVPRVWLAPVAVRELRLLVRQRQSWVDRRRAVKLRIGALLREQRVVPAAGVSRWSRRWLAWLSGEAALSAAGRWVVDAQLSELGELDGRVAAVEAHLRSVASEDRLIAALLEVRGIGLITAVMLRAEVGRFERFGSGKQLSRFCGLSPRNASSGGRSADAGLVRAANPRLRAILIEAAHRLIRLEPRWRSLAQRLRRRGKAGSVIAAAVANRWMRWLYHRMVA